MEWSQGKDYRKTYRPSVYITRKKDWKTTELASNKKLKRKQSKQKIEENKSKNCVKRK